MQRSNHWMLVVLILGVVPLSGCHKKQATHHRDPPAHVERIEGSDLSRVTLTEKAMERIGLKTTPVREKKVSRSESKRKVVPYSSVLYDPHGGTWVYKSPEPGVFVRHSIEIDYIEGNEAVLLDGPPVDTEVVTVGVVEVYGSEFEVGH